jgi:hypothetical protein
MGERRETYANSSCPEHGQEHVTGWRYIFVTFLDSLRFIKEKRT